MAGCKVSTQLPVKDMSTEREGTFLPADRSVLTVNGGVDHGATRRVRRALELRPQQRRHLGSNRSSQTQDPGSILALKAALLPAGHVRSVMAQHLRHAIHDAHRAPLPSGSTGSCVAHEGSSIVMVAVTHLKGAGLGLGGRPDLVAHDGGVDGLQEVGWQVFAVIDAAVVPQELLACHLLTHLPAPQHVS